MNYPSKLIEDCVNEISGLPGIGKKSALRLVLHLLRQDPKTSIRLAEAVVQLRNGIKYCEQCHNVSDHAVCSICESRRKESGIICVVEEIQDVLAIENTQQFHGLYHVLGGVISPIEGIGPGELKIDSLVKRISLGNIQEVILALSPTMEGDTTCFYITKKLKEFNVKVSTISRGIPIGSELEYTDEVTLGRSILARTTYQP